MTVSIARTCADPAEAELLARAVSADDPAYVQVVRDGSRLTFLVEGARAASVRSTIEDLLACLQAAERARRTALGAP